MTNPLDGIPVKPTEPGIPGWVVAVIGLLIVAGMLIALLIIDNTGSPESTRTYTSFDIACYEGYSYIHDLGPTPRTLRGEKDQQCG